MKKTLLLVVLSTLTLGLFAWNSPVTIPDVGNARLRIVGQNAHNYFFDITNSYSESKTEQALATKTTKMANAFVALEADIVALCEVEECDTILGMLVKRMNEIAGENNYTYIKDGTNSTYTKVGFIYRKDKVTPYQSTISATTQYAYKMRLRIQAFKENSTNEKFVLSMNHFKAKVNSDDEGESQRNRNTSDVINKLKSLNYDPDILIMGDLNAYTYEDCIQTLISSGYDEMLVQYDSNAYSYIYQGDRCLLDHAMANSTMAEQVTGARVYHINTAGGYNYKYSDHDAVLVGLSLGKQQRGENLDDVSTTSRAHKVLHNGQLYIEIDGIRFTITGTKIQ